MTRGRGWRAGALSLILLGLGAGCREDLRVASWPSGADASTDGGAGSPDATAPADCPTPWLLLALAGRRGEVVRFRLTADGLPQRCPGTLTGGGMLDPELLDAEMIAPDVLLTVSTASAQATSLSEDRVLWTHPFEVVPATPSEPPRAVIVPFEADGDGWGFVAYADRSSMLSRFFAHDVEGLTHREITPALLPHPSGLPLWVNVASVDPASARRVLLWANPEPQRLDPLAGTVDEVIELSPLATSAANGFAGPDGAVALTDHSTTIERVWGEPDPTIGRYVTPETCPLDLRDVAPDPFDPGHAFGLCDDEEGPRLVRLELVDAFEAAGPAAQVWHAADDPDTRATALGLYVP
ncbi:MAG TPA: hypothetical protein RMH99_21070 [Sandaracinaceae bacterium LLY-WYZ-13_1]|nr:hypothetical protein [Sandaracinaceae bacterium LLY-WYZ-13_1]